MGEDTRIHINRDICDNCLECVDFCYAQSLQAVAREMTPEQVMKEVIQDKGFYDNTGGGMTISGGEMAQPGHICTAACGTGHGERDQCLPGHLRLR